MRDPNEMVWMNMPDVRALIFHCSFTDEDLDTVSRHIIGTHVQSIEAAAATGKALTMQDCGATAVMVRKCSEFLDTQRPNTQFMATYQ